MYPFGRAALFDAINDCIHGGAQFLVVDPAQGVACAHQKATGTGAGQRGFPKSDRIAQSGANRFAGALAERAEHVVYREGSEQVADVVFHGAMEEPCFS